MAVENQPDVFELIANHKACLKSTLTTIEEGSSELVLFPSENRSDQTIK